MHAGTIQTPLVYQRGLALLRPEDVHDIRREAAVVVAAWGFETDDLSLVVSELVTNVVRHADGNGWLQVAVDNGALLVAVEDYFDTEPVLLEPDWERDSGRGVYLVEQVAAKWGTDRRRGGKTVWARLELWSRCRDCQAAVPASEPGVMRGKLLLDGQDDVPFVYCPSCSGRLVEVRTGGAQGVTACKSLVAC